MLIEAVAGQIPIKANSIDVITGRSVLHHFPNLDTIANECLRVLRPDGEIVISNEPAGMSFFNRLSQRVRSWTGSMYGRQFDWKNELAEQFGTHVWDLTQTVSYHHESGINPTPLTTVSRGLLGSSTGMDGLDLSGGSGSATTALSRIPPFI